MILLIIILVGGLFITNYMVNKYLLHRELEELRSLLIPYGEKSGFLTDDDIFKEIS